MKFYSFKNLSEDMASLYIYGAIVQDKDEDWGDKSDISLEDFKEQLDALGSIKNLDVYINSPGGNVFAASTMTSMLKRLKDKGVIITAYVDGLSASAASFLMMVADEIKLYKNSMVMVHKPMSITWGNANDMQKTIDTLNEIESSVMIPLYMEKAKENEDVIKGLINDETWFSAKEMDKYFNVTLLEEEKLAVACADKEWTKKYSIPQSAMQYFDNHKKADVGNEEQEKKPVAEIINSEPENIEETTIENNETIENEQSIKAKLNLINCSIILKKVKEGEAKHE